MNGAVLLDVNGLHKRFGGVVATAVLFARGGLAGLLAPRGRQ